MKRTENYGEVTTLLPGNIIQVKLEGGLGHIPIPEEALEVVGREPEKDPLPHPRRSVTSKYLRITAFSWPLTP